MKAGPSRAAFLGAISCALADARNQASNGLLRFADMITRWNWTLPPSQPARRLAKWTFITSRITHLSALLVRAFHQRLTGWTSASCGPTRTLSDRPLHLRPIE